MCHMELQLQHVLVFTNNRKMFRVHLSYAFQKNFTFFLCLSKFVTNTVWPGTKKTCFCVYVEHKRATVGIHRNHFCLT